MKKEKSIETAELLVKGNIMSWDGMMIQLSNVSCISTAAIELMAFPIWSVAIVLGGLLLLTEYLLGGLIVLAVGIAWIYSWYYINQKRKANTILNIVMNSGNNLQFIVGNKNFLNKILQVLEQIIIDGGIGEKNVSINIKDCTISGNAQVLNDLNYR